jgi:hypothetical protein
MFRKRRRPTPHFKIPSPYNPIHGDQANLRQDGVSPFCAMMQVMQEDTYEDYVICRGFDPRILRYMENISVAKPYGKRTTGTYEVGEIYPALLPTQGNANFMDFRNVTYMPPSPVDVNWRLGQNPGVVTGGQEGGQPENLSDAIEILYDHNGKVVNWLLIDAVGGDGAATIQYKIESIELATEGPYTGKIIATVIVETAPCSRDFLIGESVEVVDHSRCVFDLAEPELVDVWGWATEQVALSTEEGVEPGTLTPCHWAADDRCCTEAELE